jgi:DNA mismatch endonuclease (patch repair protein)
MPGKPDIVFLSARLCVFVDGDFWHGRDWPNLRHRLELRANPDYWIPKIARNIERDREQDQLLLALGWRVLRLWETDVLQDLGCASRLISEALSAIATARRTCVEGCADQR